MGLGYAVSDRDTCHLRATFYKPELSGQIDRLKSEGKAKLFLEYEDRLTICDTLILCRFFRDVVYYEELNKIVKGTRGFDLSEEDFREIVKRIALTVREFNLREGMSTADEWASRVFLYGTLLERKDMFLTGMNSGILWMSTTA